MICDNGYSPSYLLMNLTGPQQTARHHFAALTGIRCIYPQYHGKRTTPLYFRCRIRRMTPANQNGFIGTRQRVICYVPMLLSYPVLHLKRWVCPKPSAVWLSLSSGVGVQSYSSGCQRRVSAGFTHFDWQIRNNMKSQPRKQRWIF